MFTLAFIIGIYSYLIFFLGVFGVLYKSYIIVVTIAYLVLILIFNFHFSIFNQFSIIKFSNIKTIKISNLKFLLFLLFILQVIVNLIGALGPELAFDTLWYHLTLPKIYLLSHKIFYIPGGLLYYSAMPKLAEMLYIGTLTFGNEIFAKLIHFTFGILTSIVLYKLARKFFTPTIALLSVVIFYSNLVVDWESITAYVDITRTFFELISLLGIINWFQTKQKKWFIISAVMIGFAITVKVLAVGSLGIFVLLIIYEGFTKRFGRDFKSLPANRNGLKPFPTKIVKDTALYILIALLIPLPWFVFSFINTGNPVYPFFTKTYAVSSSVLLLNPITFFQSLWSLFTHSPDPLSPVYIGLVPLLIFSVKRKALSVKNEIGNFNILTLYAILSLVIWYITPDTGGGRFILPYLPVYSLLITSVFMYSFPQWFRRVLLAIVIFTAVISIAYRGIANKKYLPVIVGHETKAQFLTNNLNFSFGDFYDVDNYFTRHIKAMDTVLLYGFHNLYYVNFPFIDSSYIKKGETFNYIAVQHGTIPKRYNNWQLVYENSKTNVKLYAETNKKWVNY